MGSLPTLQYLVGFQIQKRNGSLAPVLSVETGASRPCHNAQGTRLCTFFEAVLAIGQVNVRSIETEALLAVLEGDDLRCEKLLSTMFSHELNEFQDAVSRLRSLAASAGRVRNNDRRFHP